MMYICNECGKVFREEDMQKSCERVSYGSGSVRVPYLEDTACPYCGSEYIGEAAVCQKCGEYYPAEDHPELCEVCVKEAEAMHASIMKRTDEFKRELMIEAAKGNEAFQRELEAIA